MTCPVCNEGTIRAERFTAEEPCMAFCDNQYCFSWFDIPEVQISPKQVLAPNGIVQNMEITRILRVRLPVTDTVWNERVQERLLVK